MGELGRETLALLKLSMCEGVGSVAIHRLLERFGSAERALSASGSALSQVEGLTPPAVNSLTRGAGEGVVEAELRFMEEAGAKLVSLVCEEYPSPLKHLGPGAPPLLWVKGAYEPRDALAVALVGSRRCSAYGRTQARRFAMGLAGMGFTIVSGLAWGIDAESHRAAMQCKGRTIAVVGCGLATLRETKDWELACEIAECGAVFSELPMTAPARAGNFPPRNRLISGLSLGVVVVEAARQSGSLITARLAGEQGRAVFAVPGSVDSPHSQGCHQLLRDGAVLVESPRDVVEGLGPLSEPLELPTAAEADGPAAASSAVTLNDARAAALSEDERRVFDLLGARPAQMDALSAQTGLPASVVSSALLTLEIKGLAKRLPGQAYMRA